MANTPVPQLYFSPSCADCGYREVQLPEPLPQIGDDFDWLVRDYDGFRLFIMEQLAARFPERLRWTPADMEVVLSECLSVVLDQLSDGLDRTFSEAFLATARRPDSVRRLLSLIGYDAVSLAQSAANIPQGVGSTGETLEQKRQRLLLFHPFLIQWLADYQDVVDEFTAAQQNALTVFINTPQLANAGQLNAAQLFLDNAPDFVKRVQQQALHRYWSLYPEVMEQARQAGPPSIHQQKRMVTVDDYAARLEAHPLVLRAHAYQRWSGSWQTICVAVVLTQNMPLDKAITAGDLGGAQQLASLQQLLADFNKQLSITVADWGANTTARGLIRPYVDAYRMAGQEVLVHDAGFVGINLSLSVRVAANYFQSEVRRAIEQSLGNGLGGFFEPGRLRFGEDLYASDIIQSCMALDGVEAVCLNRFKRVGRRFENRADSGHIQINGLEVAVCNNSTSKPELGILRLVLHGGRKG